MNARRKAPNKRNDSTDFVEALARGLDVIKAFGPTAMELTVSEVAARTGLARPTARRLLMTLEQLGYTRLANGAYTLTTKTLELGTAYVAAQGLWDIARPHLASLVAKTGESSSMSQLDGSDIVYTARVPVPKIIAISVQIGTRFPAAATSMGRVLLADLDKSELDEVLAKPSASGVIPRVVLSRSELDKSLAEIRERGWALSDELLSLGIRSIAAPVRDRSGRTAAAMNVTVHAAETSIERLVDEYLPLLLQTAADVTSAWSDLAMLPSTSLRSPATQAAADRSFAGAHSLAPVKVPACEGRSPVGVVTGVVAGEPALERLVGVGPAVLGDLVDLRDVDGELEEHPVGVLGVQRPAVAVFEDVGALGLPVGLLEPPLELGLALGVDLHGDVAERRRRQLRVEQLIVVLVGELEERQGTAVGEPEERVAVDPLGAEQLVRLRPRGQQREAEDVLVERPRRGLILGDVGRVVESLCDRCGGHGSSLACPLDGRLAVVRTVSSSVTDRQAMTDSPTQSDTRSSWSTAPGSASGAGNRSSRCSRRQVGRSTPCRSPATAGAATSRDHT